ncbi:hypothetical protein M413DRAFT_62699 [Hebeloma cylindrosporum]|uniref:F-box domain-containing protein n=1 Tax=Hebeloma cylindrosporum TaxID=76867 RepID=A0A0C2YCZ9_HEBCY|nr:hypothetical protein M413DRAFT_62699 [Hebeloma cylindrosporum h7]
MPPKKRKTETAKKQPVPEASTSESTNPTRSECSSNADRALLLLPSELHSEILDNFLPVVSQTRVFHDTPVLQKIYLERTDLLRALSQVCVSYRRHFLPLLWQILNLGCGARSDEYKDQRLFYKHVGDALIRKCNGLSQNSELSSFIRTVNIVFTRYQSATLIPTFSAFLQSLPHLHTLHVLHAHTQMTTALKNGFENVTLPNIKTLIIPGYCHEILKRCPRATTVWCIRDDGSKLVGVIAKHCKEVEEMRGFSSHETLLKRIIKAAPKLRIFEVSEGATKDEIKHLSSCKNLQTLIIKTVIRRHEDDDGSPLQTCIKNAKSLVLDVAPTKQRKCLRIWHEDNRYLDHRYSEPGRQRRIIHAGYFSEVDLN